MRTIEIDGQTIGEGERPFIIAEAGTNFRADVTLGKRFIEEAASAGADAIKFQTLHNERDMAREAMEELGMGDLYESIGENSLSPRDHHELKAHCENHDITFLSTPFSAESIDILEDVDAPAIKIGSGELTDFHILKTAAETGKPLIVSTGMADRETITRTCEFLTEQNADFMLLYCVSLYPTEPHQFELGVMKKLREEFEVPVGFSDHSVGISVPAAAMARGACLVEKHFTIDRRLPGGDQSVSVEPEELETLVDHAVVSHETRGSAKPVHDEEAEVAKWARHSVVTTTDITAGEELTEATLTTKRPGTGISAHRFYDILGRTATSDLPADTVLTENHLQD
jgi:N-acetylneuraminate synthase/N,N'-diacetyllegionaminate synthase